MRVRKYWPCADFFQGKRGGPVRTDRRVNTINIVVFLVIIRIRVSLLAIILRLWLLFTTYVTYKLAANSYKSKRVSTRPRNRFSVGIYACQKSSPFRPVKKPKKKRETKNLQN